MNWSKFILKALLIIICKVRGPFITLNGITIHTKVPQSITRAILYLYSGAIKFDGILSIHLNMNRFHTMLQYLVLHKKMVKDNDFFSLPHSIS